MSGGHITFFYAKVKSWVLSLSRSLHNDKGHFVSPRLILYARVLRVYTVYKDSGMCIIFSLILTHNSKLYIGYNELVTYLNQHHNKSFLGFLHCCREVVVASSMSTLTTSWYELDSFWVLKFLKEVEKFEPSLNEKVRLFYFT